MAKQQQIQQDVTLLDQLQALFTSAFKQLGDVFTQLFLQAFPGKTPDEVLADPSGAKKMVKFFNSKQFGQLVDSVLEPAFVGAEKMTSQAIVDAAYMAKGYGEKDLGVLWAKDFEVAAQIGKTNFTYIDPVATSKEALTTASKDAKNLLDFVRKEIVLQLEDGTKKGEGMLKLEKRLDGLEGITKNRADIIVRYAIIRSYNNTRLEQYTEAKKALGNELKKVWVATIDGRVCPYCLALHGSIIEVEEAFDPSATFIKKQVKFFGDKKVPPRHPRCRCTVIPYMEHWLDGMVRTPEQMVKEAADHAGKLGYAGGNVPQKTEHKLNAVIKQAQAAAGKITADNLDLTKVKTVAAKVDALSSLDWMSKPTKVKAQSVLKQYKAWETVAGAKAVLQDAAKKNDPFAVEKALKAMQHVAGAKTGYNFKQKAVAKQLVSQATDLFDAMKKLKIS